MGMLIVILVMGVALLGARRYLANFNKMGTEKGWQAYLEAVKAEYGEDSQEYQELIDPDYAEVLAFQREKIQQSSKLWDKLFIGIMVITSLLWLLSYVIPEDTVLTEVLALIILAGGGFAILWLGSWYTRQLAHMSERYVAPELEPMIEALGRADYETAQHLAATVSKKMSVFDLNNAIIPVVYISAGNFEKAREYIDADMAFIKKNITHYSSLYSDLLWVTSVMYAAEKDYAKAIQVVDESLTAHENNLFAHMLKAELLLFTRQNTDLALEHINTMLASGETLPQEQQKTLATPMMIKAWILTRLRRRQAADESMKKAFALLEQDVELNIKSETYRFAAHVAIERRSYDVAKTFLAKALDADPNGLNGRLARELQAELNTIGD